MFQVGGDKIGYVLYYYCSTYIVKQALKNERDYLNQSLC